MISITTVIQYIHKYKTQAETNAGGNCPFRYERFINFWLRFFDTRIETQFLKAYANHTTWPQRAAHLVMSKVSVGRDPKNPTTSFNSRKSSLCLHGHISTPNWQFFKIFKYSGPFLLGMTPSTLQPYFLSGGLLWQWWLSYPLRASVKCTNWLYTWAVNPNSSKPNQTE